MVEFAVATDPKSDVFRSITGSRRTVTRRTMDLHQKVLVPEVFKGVNNSHFWSLMVDDSTDTGTHEQMILYVRFIDSRLQPKVTRFLGVKRIEGHPNAENLCRSIMSVIGSEGSGYALPTDRLVSFTTDGASVTLSSQNGVLGKIRNEIGNAKLLSQHCCPHRLVLASKASQHLLPDWIEQTVASAIDYFKGSPCRRDEFQKFLQLAEPGGEYRRIVDYHRIRWLSLRACVDTLCTVLPHLVNFFEREKGNQQNDSQTRKRRANCTATCQSQNSVSTCTFLGHSLKFWLT